MTAHEMTLPGMPRVGRSVKCRGDYCYANVRNPKKDDTVKAWHSALQRGEKVIAQYLREHNNDVAHREKCKFQDLPPSVHHWCSGRGYDALEHELELLKEARHRLS